MNTITDSTIVNIVVDSLPMQYKIDSYNQMAKNISEISNSLTENLIKVLAGSLILLFGSNFLRPVDFKYRIPYLLFIPSWISMGFSFYYSNSINRMYASLSSFRNINDIKDIIYENGGLSNHYEYQSFSFYLSILFIFLWLLFYICWWVFYEQKSTFELKN